MAQLPFIGPTYQNQSATADAELCINWYPEILTGSSIPSKAILLPTPGVSTFCTLPTYPVRGEFSMAGRSFFVGGDTLYELTLSPTDDWPDAATPIGTAVALGTMSTNQYPATLCSNGDAGGQMFITSGGNGYIFDLLANTLTLVTDAADMGVFLQGYFIKLDFSTSAFELSDLEDGTVWPGQGSRAQRSLASDPWVSMATVHGELWLLGEQTSEIWQNVGGTVSFPFAPIPGAFMEQGCAASFSVARLGSSLTWLAQNDQGMLTVCRSSGYQPVRVSTNAVDYAIQQFSDQSDADAFAYQDQGHEFYVLNLPSANQTWAYDLTTNLWAQRGYWNQALARFDVARPSVHSVAFGYTLVGDRVTGDVMRQDVSLTTDSGGVAIRRVRRAVTLTDEQKWMTYPSVQLVLDVGVANVIQGSAYADTIMQSSPSNYFRLGETSGPRFYDSVVGSVASISTDAAELGKPGLVHDANLAYINDDSADHQIVTGIAATGTTFTIEISLKPDHSQQVQSDIGGVVGNVVGFGLIYNMLTSRLGWDVTPGAPYSYWSVPVVNLNTYHVVVSVAAGVGTLYLNGENQGTISGIPSMTIDALGQNLQLPGFSSYGGTLDEFVYYAGRALSAEEALEHYEATQLTVREAQIMLRSSKDNCRTWGPEQWRGAGSQGRWATRAIWRQQGRARTCAFEVTVADGIPWRLVDFIGTPVRGNGT